MLECPDAKDPAFAASLRALDLDLLVIVAFVVLPDAVLDSGRTIRFAGMNSIDRRAFHKSLGELEGVRTESDGEGILRRLRAFGGRRSPQGTETPERSEG